jgi:hypothetical protein
MLEVCVVSKKEAAFAGCEWFSFVCAEAGDIPIVGQMAMQRRTMRVR